MDTHFHSIFRQIDAPGARGKYLSRVFGIFSEEIVRQWASDPRSPYEDLGRPTLRKRGERSGSTLDFTLRHKNTGKSYVAELKCEIEYQNYKYLVLSDAKQLDHHNKAAFFALLDAAAKNPEQQAFVNKKELKIDGAILIWGAATPEGRRAVVDAKGFFDVLTMAEIIGDLRSWGCEPYRKLVEQKRSWTNEMFDALLQAPK
ncbi:hypothetical protein TMS3_0110300 [Pseudomonas taeanensis MS-3]|uniref:Uncharacterized protein n=1 Tax=Pseudomonas taeanensis MS-3 TaxID=1395571 RepID=A0A0A1YMN5_9PSED|nr:hypothetical protein [Pseudomonas taeanensis]KFX69894.1 hypothetical protein TMS3_0110300 [Pseudomonas taeanensis MS-3]